MTECIDLKKRFGNRYRVFTADSYFAETGSPTNRNTDPWNWELRGSRGHICPWGGELLAVCLNDGHTILAKRLTREPWIDTDRSQIGDNSEVNAVFHVDHIEEAAEYAKLWRKRQVSEPERMRLAELGKANRLNGGGMRFTDGQGDATRNTTT